MGQSAWLKTSWGHATRSGTVCQAVSGRPGKRARSAFVPLMDPLPASAVPIQAPERIGAPGATRTPDLRVRSPTLYPTELRAPGAITTTSSSRLSRMGCEGLRKTRGAAGVQRSLYEDGLF